MSLARFIDAQRTEHGVPHTVACRALGRSTSWLYKWLDRPPTPRQQRRAELAERTRKSFIDSGGTYGSPRVVLDLRAVGERGVGEYRGQDYADGVLGRSAASSPAWADPCGKA